MDAPATLGILSCSLALLSPEALASDQSRKLAEEILAAQSSRGTASRLGSLAPSRDGRIPNAWQVTVEGVDCCDPKEAERRASIALAEYMEEKRIKAAWAGRVSQSTERINGKYVTTLVVDIPKGFYPPGATP